MKFKLSWLKRHLKTEATIKEVAEAMTLAGLEAVSYTHLTLPTKA